MIVSIFNRQKDLPLEHEREKIARIANVVVQEEQEIFDEVSIFFITNKAMCQKHKKFFNDPSPTDCISFPMDKDEAFDLGTRILGDIFICPQTALLYAQENQKDPYTEMTLYLVHGLLHLLGFDDIERAQRKIMRSKEKKYMKLLSHQSLQLSPPNKYLRNI